jgi:hypothetical protein
VHQTYCVESVGGMTPEQQDQLGELATTYAGKSLDDLALMEQAIKDARNLKKDMKLHDVPEEDVLLLRAAMQLANQKKRITVPINIVIETEGYGLDHCTVYTRVVEPEYLSEWECEVYLDSVWKWPEGVSDQIKANEEEMKNHLKTANKVFRDFEKKHDVEADSFL